MKHYKFVEFLSNLNVKSPCTNVEPPRAKLKPPIDTVLVRGLYEVRYLTDIMFPTNNFYRIASKTWHYKLVLNIHNDFASNVPSLSLLLLKH